MALVQEYFSLTETYRNKYGNRTLLLMQVGSFFECYAEQKGGEYIGSNIIDFCRICDLNMADKKMTQKVIVMAGFSLFMIDKYLKKMMDAEYTVVVYTQDEQKSNTTRSLAGIYSPGTHFSLDSTQVTNNTACIWLQITDTNQSSAIMRKMLSQPAKQWLHIGVVNIDIYTGKVNTLEYNTQYLKNPTTFDELERFLSVYRPSEVILIGNMEDREMNDVIQYAGIQCSTVHRLSQSQSQSQKQEEPIWKRVEKQIYQKEILNTFYKEKGESIYENTKEYPFSLQSLCYLLDFLFQHNPSLVNSISPPTMENQSLRLRLANHSLKQLNIIDESTSKTSKYSSVLSFLNECTTTMGRRAFASLLLNPTSDTILLEKEYKRIATFVAHLEKMNWLTEQLSFIKDLSKMQRQIVMKRISPKHLFQLASNGRIVEYILGKYKEIPEIISILQKTTGLEESLHLLIDFLQMNLDLNKCKDIDTLQQFETHFFKVGVDSILDAKRELLLDTQDKLEAIRSYFNQLMEKYEKKGSSNNGINTEYIKFHETDKNSQLFLVSTKRRCSLLKQALEAQESTFPVTLSYISSIDGSTRSFLISLIIKEIQFSTQSASNESISFAYIDNLCKIISTTKAETKELLWDVYDKAILTPLSSDTMQSALDAISAFVVEVDVLFTKASLATKYNYCRPVLKDNIQEPSSKKETVSFLKAEGLRHCLIEHIQKREIYVTNDVALEGTSILLFGTNAVGKTSLIRAIGIAIIMAQAGLYVPCKTFVFAPYTSLYTRIIGNDNLFNGLSTFDVEMCELRTILREANETSLVLGDELCSGTESTSAKSIFAAGLMQLAKKGCSSIFATHLHEITEYDEIRELERQCVLSLKHMEVIYDKERDTLVYNRKLKEGPGGNMYGLEVCKSLSLPADFLETANQIRMKYNDTSASILSLKTSNYNARKLMHLCEECGKDRAVETHHIVQQREADEDGFIRLQNGTVYHKNHAANLRALCEGCHKKEHSKIK
jgi:DNA mismatch repair protein MutS